MMNPDDKRNIRMLLIVLLPTLFWLGVARATEHLTDPKLKALLHLLTQTHEKPLLLIAIVFGLASAILLIWLMDQSGSDEFHGAYFRKFLRGTKIVSSSLSIVSSAPLALERPAPSALVGEDKAPMITISSF